MKLVISDTPGHSQHLPTRILQLQMCKLPFALKIIYKMEYAELFLIKANYLMRYLLKIGHYMCE